MISKKTKIAWLLGCLVLLAAAGAGAFRFAGASDECVGNLPRQATWPSGQKECPVVGNIGGVKLAIPRHYLLGPVTYKGVDIWRPETYKNRPKRPAFDNEIENFAIRLRISDFRPIEARRDWDDYRWQLERIIAPASPPHANRWIHVGINSDTVYSNQKCSGSLRCYFDGTMKDVAEQGPFFLQRDTAYGLDHYVSRQRPTVEKSVGHFDEFYYDAASQKTFIGCSNKPMVVPPHVPLEYCDHRFVIPELPAEVSVDYFHPAKEEITRWRDVESNVRAIVQSFIVT